MALSQISFRHQLQIIPGDVILVPGCEPPSEISTLRFAANYALSGCDGGYVDLKDALAAIPGSRVIQGINFGPRRFKQRWYVFPDQYIDCCSKEPDYFAILRALPKSNTEEEEDEGCGNELMHADWCNAGCGAGTDDALPAAPETSGSGACDRRVKAPYFRERAVGIPRGAQQDPYFDEGGPGPLSRGVLPQVPPNQRD